MGFTEEVRKALLDRVGKSRRFANNKRMADELEIDPSQLNRFLKRERGLNAESLGRILDKLGASITFPDQDGDTARQVCFVSGKQKPGNAESPTSDDYIAVPLVRASDIDDQRGIAEEHVEAWILVWRHHESIRFRTRLAAVQIEAGELAMTPMLHPGDVVLIDLADKDPSPAGKLMLTRKPGNPRQTLIRRTHAHPVEGDMELVFYSENSREYPPSTYRLERDYHGEISAALLGSVVWSWSDMTKK